jgi:hypothetical protein
VACILARNDTYECMLVISPSTGLVILALSRREPNCTRSLQISACPSTNFKFSKFQLKNWTRPFTLRPDGSNLRDVRFEILTDHIPSLKRLSVFFVKFRYTRTIPVESFPNYNFTNIPVIDSVLTAS